MSVIMLAWPPVHCNTRESQFCWHCYHTNKNIRNKRSSGCKVETSVSMPPLFLHLCMRCWLRRWSPFIPREEQTTYRCRESLFDCVHVMLILNDEAISLMNSMVIIQHEQFFFSDAWKIKWNYSFFHPPSLPFIY